MEQGVNNAMGWEHGLGRCCGLFVACSIHYVPMRKARLGYDSESLSRAISRRTSRPTRLFAI